MKNYRPISLANTHYKLLAHILANRMHQVLDKIISTDQTGYIKNRYIGTNIRKILDTTEYLTNNKKSGILLFLDFEKAFDTVEWPFVFQVMKKFNFGKPIYKLDQTSISRTMCSFQKQWMALRQNKFRTRNSPRLSSFSSTLYPCSGGPCH